MPSRLRAPGRPWPSPPASFQARSRMGTPAPRSAVRAVLPGRGDEISQIKGGHPHGPVRFHEQPRLLRALCHLQEVVGKCMGAADRLPLTLHAGRPQTTDGGQGTRAGQDHPEVPQRQRGGLGLAHMGQMVHDRCQPWVEPCLAKHGFPPCGCGSLHTPQSAVGREVTSPAFQKTSPCKSPLPPPDPTRGVFGPKEQVRNQSGSTSFASAVRGTRRPAAWYQGEAGGTGGTGRGRHEGIGYGGYDSTTLVYCRGPVRN